MGFLRVDMLTGAGLSKINGLRNMFEWSMVDRVSAL